MKNFCIIVLLILFGVYNNVNAQTPNYLWAKKIGGNNNDESRSVAVDAVGNVYTTGYFQGTVDFDPGTGTYNLSSAGGMDIFISKLDASGNFLWAKRFGGASDDRAFSNITDAAGNVYTTGFFQGTVDFDPGPGTFNLTSAGNWDVFISKLDISGNLLWAKRIGGGNNEVGFYIVSDPNGNVYTTGAFGGTADFDPGTANASLTSAGGNDIFISKLNSSGNYLWAKRMGGINNDQAFAAAVDVAGNIYTTGYFYGTADFDPGAATFNLTSAGISDVFISKLNDSGNFLWAKQLAGTDNSEGSSVFIDATGNAYTTGYFKGTADFDPGPGTFNLTSAGDADIFISKLNPSGNFIWAKRMGGSGDDRTYSNVVDANGNVYTTGYFFNTADFDPGAGTFSLTSTGNYDIFISKLDDSGGFLWAKQMSGANGEVGYAITSDANANIYITGYFEGTVDFNPGTAINELTSNGSQDVFIVKLCQMATPTVTADGLTTFCQGESVTLTSGTANSYLWNNGATTQSITVSTSGSYSVIVTNANGCSASSSPTTVTVNPSPVATITPVGPISLCQGDTVTLTSNVTSSYLWSNGATTQSIVVSTSGNYSLTTTNNFGCSAVSSATLVTVDPILDASVAIIGPTTICLGQNATFTATPTNGGTAPTFQWFVNDSPVGIGLTYSTTALTNGAQVYCTMTSSAVCVNPATATSNSLPITVNPTLIPGVDVTASFTSICSGQNVTFTAIPANGGSLPSYEWYVNGMNVGGNSSTYSTSALSNVAEVYCVMTSNAVCANPKIVKSDTVIITVNPLLIPKVSVTASPECTFTANPTNGGPSPSYQWYVNDSLVGNNNETYTNTMLINGWEVYCIMTSNAVCANPLTDTSAIIIVTNCLVGADEYGNVGNIVVFPNPSSDYFTIKGSGLAGDSYKITFSDILGQVLMEMGIDNINGSGFTTQVNVAELSNGHYFITIHAESGRHVFAVQKW